MAKKLYIGNLSYDTAEENLKEYFAKVGEIESAVIIKDKLSGRSKGFGFVEYKDEKSAEQAIATLNGAELDGRNITVAEARPMEERPARTGGYNRAGGGGYRDRNRGGYNRGAGGGGYRDRNQNTW